MGTSASRAAAPDIEERESLLGGSSAATLGSLKAKLGLGKREPPPEPPCPCLPELSYTMRFGGFVFCSDRTSDHHGVAGVVGGA